jgi:MFS family permease
MLTDRINPRNMVAPGIIVVALAFGGLSLMGGNVFVYYVELAAMSVLGNLSGTCALTPILVAHFHRSRGAALGIAMAGIGLGAAVAGPLVALTISASGWRGGYRAISLFCLAMTPIVWRLLKSSARAVAASEDHSGSSVREALSAPTYWLLSTALFSIALGSTGLIIHFVPLLTDQGMDSGTAAGVSSAIGLCVILSRLFTGFMVDRFFAPRVAAAIMLAGAMGYVVFARTGTHFAIVGALAIGISFGAETDLVGFMVSRYFGLRNYGRLFGVMYGLCLSGTVISPMLYGWVKDHVGTYFPMIHAAAGLLTFASGILATLPPFPRWQNADVEAAPHPSGAPAAL